MSKVVAKVKKKQRLQAEAEAIADDFSRMEVVQRKERPTNTDVTSVEIRNVMADSIERLWDELHATHKGEMKFRDEEHIRANAEESARYISGSLVHGLHGHGPSVKIREATVTPRYCREHR